MYRYHALKINGKRIDEHRLIMENHLGRKLSKNEVVHHIDGVKSNNSLDNLQVMTRSEHSRIHQNERIKNGTSCPNIGNWVSEHKNLMGLWNRKAIDCFTKDGVFVKHYESMTEAEKDGFTNQCVSDVVNGKKKHINDSYSREAKITVDTQKKICYTL